MLSPFGLLIDRRFKEHQTALGHPEMPERLEAVGRGLVAAGIIKETNDGWESQSPGYVLVSPQELDDAAIEAVHTRSYVERLKAACAAGMPYIDTPDSFISRESEKIARLAAGGVVAAARRVADGGLRSAFCAVRPPGHHAEADRSMGFCLYANVALAVRAVQLENGIERVLVLDWDVHHGNGTQHIFEADPSVLFISLHGHPDTLYPGTGYAHETGIGPGKGFTLNIPLAPGAGDAEFRQAFERQIEPRVTEFRPEMIFISCGFDAHGLDPLGNLELDDDTYVWMTQRVAEWSRQHAGGRVLSVLEGGYNHDVLGRCAALHVQELW